MLKLPVLEMKIVIPIINNQEILAKKIKIKIMKIKIKNWNNKIKK